MNPSLRARIVFAAIGMIAVVPLFAAGQETQATKPAAPKGVVIRGCLAKEKLSRIDPQNVTPVVELKLPDVLRVTSIRAIRDQVKAMNGHQVEVTGSLRAIPGLETGMLVVDSDAGKLYFGGGDPEVSRKEEPTIHITLIKDLGTTCPGQSK